MSSLIGPTPPEKVFAAYENDKKKRSLFLKRQRDIDQTLHDSFRIWAEETIKNKEWLMRELSADELADADAQEENAA